MSWQNHSGFLVLLGLLFCGLFGIYLIVLGLFCQTVAKQLPEGTRLKSLIFREDHLNQDQILQMFDSFCVFQIFCTMLGVLTSIFTV